MVKANISLVKNFRLIIFIYTHIIDKVSIWRYELWYGTDN